MKVVAYGGGTNSTALLVLLRDQGITPDLIMFADTGGEKPHTYEHLKVVNAWCESIGFPSIQVVRKRGRVYVGETLEENCLRKNMLPSIAYGFKTCSLKYKVQPQDMFCNNHPQCKEVWAAGGKVTKFIGYDADEERRAKNFEDDKYKFEYPLLKADWGRDECVEAIARAGLPQPGKSACFFCPSSTKPEILALRAQYPELLDRALAMERNADLQTVKGLGRRFSWKEFPETVPEGTPDTAMPELLSLFSTAGNEIPCGCYDGE